MLAFTDTFGNNIIYIYIYNCHKFYFKEICIFRILKFLLKIY